MTVIIVGVKYFSIFLMQRHRSIHFKSGDTDINMSEIVPILSVVGVVV